MKYLYYFKFIIYSGLALYCKHIELRIGFVLLAILMLFFATQTSIEDYIDKKFDELKK